MTRSQNQSRFTCIDTSPMRINQAGFSLVELLTVMAILVILAAMLFPLLSKAKEEAKSIVCRNNLKQMTLGWQLYSMDHRESLVRNDPTIEDARWTGGSLLTYSLPKYPGNWDHDRYTRMSPLWPYSGNATDIWRCPSDRSFGINADGAKVPRIRSISMNLFLGVEPGFTHPGTHRFRYFRKESDLTEPGPAKTFVFTDERYDSISDGSFHVSMSGYRGNPTVLKLANLPGRYHNGSGSLSFADGHAERKSWSNPLTLQPYREKGFRWIEASPYNSDVVWLQERSTAMRASW